MDIVLPEAVAAFFAAGDGTGDEALAKWLSDDTVVRDENHTYVGSDAILAWLEEAREKYRFRAQPLRVEQRGATTLVRARVTGDFPGSPIEIDYAFVLEAGLVRELEIG